MIEFLSDSNELAAADVLIFAREAIQKFENLRPLIIENLLDAFSGIKTSTIHRSALWILGEYANTLQDITATMSKIHLGLGEVRNDLNYQTRLEFSV